MWVLYVFTVLNIHIQIIVFNKPSQVFREKKIRKIIFANIKKNPFSFSVNQSLPGHCDGLLPRWKFIQSLGTTPVWVWVPGRGVPYLPGPHRYVTMLPNDTFHRSRKRKIFTPAPAMPPTSASLETWKHKKGTKYVFCLQSH